MIRFVACGFESRPRVASGNGGGAIGSSTKFVCYRTRLFLPIAITVLSRFCSTSLNCYRIVDGNFLFSRKREVCHEQIQRNQNNENDKSCGYPAYAMTDKAKLVAQVMTTFFGEPKFYGDNTPELISLATKLTATSPEFVANLARYARKEMHLRSVSHALAVLIAHEERSKPFIKQVVTDVVERPDDITEILALYLTAFGKPIPNGLKKALGDALGKFDAYQISKYSGGKKAVKFIDVLRLTHVKPKTPEQSALFDAIANDALPKAVRWETELSAKGNTTEVWEELIDGGKLGYMATLRNLRNIVNAQPKNLDKALEALADKERVLRSKQLPMRFLAAYREVRNCPAGPSKSPLLIQGRRSDRKSNRLLGRKHAALARQDRIGNRRERIYDVSAEQAFRS